MNGPDAHFSNKGAISTTGDDARGVYSTGTRDTVENAGSITTTGAKAYGIFATGFDAAVRHTGSIETTGAEAHGIFVDARERAALVDVGRDATVIASGADARGVLTYLGFATHVRIAGRVSGGSGAHAAGVHMSDGGTIEVTETGRVDAISNVGFRVVKGDMHLIINSDDLTYLDGLEVQGSAKHLTDVTVRGTNFLDDNAVTGRIPKPGPYDFGLSALDDVAEGWSNVLQCWVFGDVVAPRGAVYEALPRVLLSMQQSGPPRRRQRTGGVSPWFNVEAAVGSHVPVSSTLGAKFNYDMQGLWAGIDVPIGVRDDARQPLVLGIGARYLQSSAVVLSEGGRGEVEATGLGIFATASWLGPKSRFYADAQAATTWYEADLSSSRIGLLKDNAQGLGWSVDLEVGRRFGLSPIRWSVTPRLGLLYARAGLDEFTDKVGSRVAIQDGDSLQGRVGTGLRYHGEARSMSFYAAADLTHEFRDETRVSVSGTNVVSRAPASRGWFTVGATRGWPGPGSTEMELFGEIRFAVALGQPGGGHETHGNIGIRFGF